MSEFKEELAGTLREIASELKGIRAMQGELQGLVVKLNGRVGSLEQKVIEDSSRTGEQVRRNTNAIIGINAHLAREEQPGNGAA